MYLTIMMRKAAWMMRKLSDGGQGAKITVSVMLA
jgi:hypothetical protein